MLPEHQLNTVAAEQNFLNPGIELTATWRVYSGTGQAIHSTAFDLNIIAHTLTLVDGEGSAITRRFTVLDNAE